MQVRVYDFVTGITTGTQPDAGTPTLSSDLITKGYADTNFVTGTKSQVAPTGTVNNVNVTFTLPNTPISNADVELYKNGLIQHQGGGLDYTISTTTITMAVAPNFGEKLWVVYRY